MTTFALAVTILAAAFVLTAMSRRAQTNHATRKARR